MKPHRNPSSALVRKETVLANAVALVSLQCLLEPFTHLHKVICSLSCVNETHGAHISAWPTAAEAQGRLQDSLVRAFPTYQAGCEGSMQGLLQLAKHPLRVYGNALFAGVGDARWDLAETPLVCRGCCANPLTRRVAPQVDAPSCG